MVVRKKPLMRRREVDPLGGKELGCHDMEIIGAGGSGGDGTAAAEKKRREE